jgi:uncharacterized protein
MSGERYGGAQRWLDRGFARLSHWAVAHTGWVLGAFTSLTLVGLLLAARVTQDNSLDAYFDPSDPAFIHYKAFQKEFNSDEVIYLVYKGKSDQASVFDLDTMKTIDRLTRAIEQEVPCVRKVTSLANVELIESRDDDIVIHRLNDQLYNTPELAQLRDATMSKPLYVGTLVSKDARYGAILVEMTLASTDPIEKLRVDPYPISTRKRPITA